LVGKEFVQNIAIYIDGVEAHDPDEEIDVNGALGSVIQYWKNFTAGWQLEFAGFWLTIMIGPFPRLLNLRCSKVLACTD